MYPVHHILEKFKKGEIYSNQFIALSDGFSVAHSGATIVRTEISKQLTNLFESEWLEERKEYFIHGLAWERMYKSFKANKDVLSVNVWLEDGEVYSGENGVQMQAPQNFHIGFHEGCGMYTTVKVFNNSDLNRITIPKTGYPYWQRVWEQVRELKMETPVDEFAINSEFTEKIIKCFDKPYSLTFLVSESTKAIKIVSGEQCAILMPITNQHKIEFPAV